MDLQLRGKRAFVSGSSSGLGRAIALELAAEGCDVAVHGRDKARTEETAHAVEALGVKAVVAIGDLAREADCESVAKAAAAGLGGPEIIVNNVGAALRKDNPAWSDLAPKAWLDSFDVNFMSVLRMSQLLLPGVVAAGWGRFINISTGGATMAGVLPDYTAPKAALNKLTSDMSQTVGRYGATANGVMPGIVKTPAIEDYLQVVAGKLGWDGDPDEIETRYLTEIAPQPVARMGQARDVASLTAFLASPLAGYITGVTIRIDGGIAKSVHP